MKLARTAISKAVDRPDAATRFFLLHGADGAGSRALGARLLSGIGAEKLPLTGAALKADPATLADEACAISMFGGRKLLWIEPAGEEILPAVEALLAAPAVEHVAVAIAGTLKKTSGLLKLAEASPLAAACQSYIPEGQEADRLVQDLGRREGLAIDPRTASRIAAAAANDQALIRQELAKFALYLDASPDSPKPLDEEVIDLLGADASESDANAPGDLALSGAVDRLARELERLESCGIEPIPVVRALQRRLLMLMPLCAKVEGGQPASAVMTSVWQRDKAVVGQILPKWNAARLTQIFERVQKLERDVLLSPVNDRAALGEALLQIARAAGR